MPTHTVARWLCDKDGKVFRVGVATPPYVPTADAAADVDFVLNSFRRLPMKSGGAWPVSYTHLSLVSAVGSLAGPPMPSASAAKPRNWPTMVPSAGASYC